MRTSLTTFWRKLLFAAISVMACLLLLNACTTFNRLRYRPRITTIIEPRLEDLRASSIGVLNFQAGGNSLGRNIAGAVHQYLLQHRFMRVVELAGSDYRSDEDAIAIGRRLGYDLVLLGSVNEFSDGGLANHSKVSISLKIIDTQTAVTLWYISGSLEARPEEMADYMLFMRDGKPATSPFILCTVLMKKILKNLTKL